MALQSYLTNFINNLGGFANGNGYAGGTLDTIVTMQDPILGGHGVPPRKMCSTVSIAATDNALSNYLIYKNLSADDIIYDFLAEVDASSGLTSMKIGIFDSLTGVALVDNAFLNAADWHAGSTKLAPFDAAAALTHQNTIQTIGALAGKTLTNQNGTYDIVLTSTNAPTQASLLTFRANLIPSG